MLSLINKDKENRTLTRRNTYYNSYRNPYTSELSLTQQQDGTIASNQDDLFNYIIDNDNIYKLITHWFIQKNPTQFYFEDGNTSFVQRHAKSAKIDDNKKLLTDNVIKSFSKTNVVNIPLMKILLTVK